MYMLNGGQQCTYTVRMNRGTCTNSAAVEYDLRISYKYKGSFWV